MVFHEAQEACDTQSHVPEFEHFGFAVATGGFVERRL
jgi:hypothetical protein